MVERSYSFPLRVMWQQLHVTLWQPCSLCIDTT